MDKTKTENKKTENKKDRKMIVLRKNREELKQYYFVIKQLVDREIKKKICEVISRSHLECVKSADDHGSYVHDLQHNLQALH